MEHIRRSGGNGWQFFSPELNRAVTERMLLGAALKRAVSDHRLRLVYQPQINVDTGELYGLEALARWRGSRTRRRSTLPVYHTGGRGWRN